MSDVAPTTADPDERVRIDLLGGFRVVVGNCEVRADAWPGRRAAELVQLLALAANRLPAARPGDRGALAAPHPQAGAANLRKAAHQARQALGREDAVVLGGGRVVLLPVAEVDVERF